MAGDANLIGYSVDTAGTFDDVLDHRRNVDPFALSGNPPLPFRQSTAILACNNPEAPMNRIVESSLYLPAVLVLAALGDGIVEALAVALGF